MLAEFFLTLWLFFSGFLFCTHLFEKKDILNKLIFSYPISSTYTVIGFQLFSVFGIKITYTIILLFEILKFLSLIKLKIYFSTKNLKHIIFYISLIIIPFFLLPWITHDSSMFALYSQAILNSKILDFPESGLVSYGFYLSGLHSFYNVFTDSPFTVSIPFCFGISFTILLIKTSFNLLKHEYKINLNILIFLLVLLTTPMYILGFVYIHNNLISSFFIFSTFILLMKDLKFKNFLNQILIFSLILGVLVSRMENGIIFSILGIFLLLFNKHTIKYRFGIYCGIFYGYFWYLLIYFKSREYSDVILSENTSLMILLSLLILNILIIFHSKLIKISKFINLKLTFYILLLLILIPFLIQPLEAFESFKALSLNAALVGKWSFFWYIFLIFVFINDGHLFYKYKKKVSSNSGLIFLVLSLLFFVLIYLMSFFRVPYRLGYGDSGNRLLITIFPFAVQYMFFCIYEIKKNKKLSFFT